MLKKLVHARSRLQPELRAHDPACPYSGFQCLYSLGAWDFGAQLNPSLSHYSKMVVLNCFDLLTYRDGGTTLFFLLLEFIFSQKTINQSL